MIALVAMLALIPPLPPPPIERATALPAYSADCRLAGRDTQDHRISVAISGVGDSRMAIFAKGSGPMRKLAALGKKTFVVSTGNHAMSWQTTDFIDAHLAGRAVTVVLDVNPDLAEGAAIRIVDPRRSHNLPLFAGLCRTKALKGRPSS